MSLLAVAVGGFFAFQALQPSPEEEALAVAEAWVAVINADEDEELRALVPEGATPAAVESLKVARHPIDDPEYALVSDMPATEGIAWVVVSGSAEGVEVSHRLMVSFDAEERRWVLSRRN